jgi:SecD/SecF fusion protein
MTDRRRNFFILSLVGLLLAASIGVLLAKSTKLGLDLKGGVELVYQAKPTKQSTVNGEAIDRSIDIMRKRVDALGVTEPEIQRSGSDQITVSLPDVKNAKEAADQVGTTAQLFFYDWEKNVIGPEGRPVPLDPNVTGGQAAGNVSSACKPQYDAVIRASRRPAQTNENQATESKFYLLNDKTRKVIAGPEPTLKDLRSSDRAVAFRAKGTGDGRVKIVKPGTLIVRAEVPDNAKGAAKTPDCFFVLNDAYALRGTDIKNPEQNFDPNTQAPNVTFDFTDSGRKKWKDTTKEIAQRGQDAVGILNGADANQHFAIVLDNELVSVPFIDFRQNPDGIDGGNGSEISGGFTIDSAQSLANELKYGALPVTLKLVSQSQVSATLGKEALDQGLTAGIAGFVIVALFLLIFYRVLGVIAVGALVVYAIYFYALIKLIPITLTLPGIAGLILTIGVAADANIVIFERVKEEIRAGRSVTAGIAQGYKKGIAAIIDANVVTFMTAFILFMIATAGVRGFAFTLGIGTLVSLFTAVLLTQAILGTMGRSRMISHPSALGVSEKKGAGWSRFDFMGASRYFFSASGIILLVGALAIGGKGLNFGIDFQSGTRIQAAFVKSPDEGQVRDVLAKQGVDKGAEIQRSNDKTLGDSIQISTTQLQPEKAQAVVSALDDQFQIKGQPQTQSIGPTFGNTVANSAIIAIIASLIVISAYIALRFEWKYAVPVLIAVMHDILIVSGVYALTDREVTTSTVAALLTILGYSLYDTIIVFDRIRENVPRMPRAAYSQIVNRSMAEVLTRSLATSFCTLLPILALMLFGGETLKDFAFALLVGVVSGAYSSVFIASPVLTHWKEREGVYRRRSARIRAANNGIVPAYATGASAAEVKEAERQRRARLTAPQDPAQGVSKAEFEAMVRDIQHEAPAATSVEDDPGRDLTPDELVMKDEKKPRGPKGPRNKRHGRPR